VQGVGFYYTDVSIILRELLKIIGIYIHIYIYTYIHIYICVCVKFIKICAQNTCRCKNSFVTPCRTGPEDVVVVVFIPVFQN
jgi:hypothetical protein